MNKYIELKNRHQNELKQVQLIYAFNRKDLNDGLKKLGLKKTDFIYDMFSYELANHEYTYTRDLSDTLNVLNISERDIKNNPNLKNGLKLAVEDALQYERKKEEYEL